MRRKVTIFSKLIKVISKKDFDQLVETYRADHYVKNFDAWSHFLVMLYAQLSHQESLRTIEMNFNYAVAHKNIRGVSKVKRSTLSDANQRRPADFFKSLCQLLIQKLVRQQKKKLKEAIRLIDSTPIQLLGRGHEWAEKTQRIKGLKVHFIYDPTDTLPIYFSFTSPRVNDIVEGQKLIPKPGMIFVYDRAYYDFKWWNSITDTGAVFVTRTKNTLAYKIVAKDNCLKDNNLILDAVIKLTSRQRYKHKSPLRLIKAWIDINGKKKQMRLITNSFKLSATDVLNLYKKRWAIETFFKWIKQNLKIKRFFGENENAIKTQISVAIITYILLKLLGMQSRDGFSIRKLITFLKVNLFNKIREYVSKKGDIGPPWALVKPRKCVI